MATATPQQGSTPAQTTQQQQGSQPTPQHGSTPRYTDWASI